MWWDQRRPEIVEDFEREVLGRIPKSVPKVTWEVTKTAEAMVGGHPVIGKQLLGHVDNSSDPQIPVDIQMTLVLPAGAKGPVPVMMMFGGRTIPEVAFPMPAFPGRGAPAGGAPAAGRGPVMPPANADLPATEQLIADGWGFASINPSSIQADNGAGLTKGIIGLVNRGQPRKPDDWGALRAWGWGASRGLDDLETDKAVNAKQVGIEGVSRYGKAALVTMAFDRRFAVVLIGSSGEGGAKLHRRNWGEAVENLTGSGEYHWMAGNFLKYGAAEATFGSKTPGDLPVDAHELIALCAPRLTFVSYGVPEKGDAKWLDHQGSFMAAVAVQPVFRLLGAKDLGVTADYRVAKMPPVNAGLLDGQLAWLPARWRALPTTPNWKYFIPWADKFLHHARHHGGPPRPKTMRDVEGLAARLNSFRRRFDLLRFGDDDFRFAVVVLDLARHANILVQIILWGVPNLVRFSPKMTAVKVWFEDSGRRSSGRSAFSRIPDNGCRRPCRKRFPPGQRDPWPSLRGSDRRQKAQEQRE